MGGGGGQGGRDKVALGAGEGQLAAALDGLLRYTLQRVDGRADGRHVGHGADAAAWPCPGLGGGRGCSGGQSRDGLLRGSAQCVERNTDGCDVGKCATCREEERGDGRGCRVRAMGNGQGS